MDMITNTKHTPKSCSCQQCIRGKHTAGGHTLVKADERAYRHAAKIALAHIGGDLDEEIFQSAPIGNYYD
jgi:hypothetical protein